MHIFIKCVLTTDMRKRIEMNLNVLESLIEKNLKLLESLS